MCANCKTGTEGIGAVLMNQKYFRQWRPYLAQMYRKNPRDTERRRYRLLDYHWANFGWGKDVNGNATYHPETMWLYKCQGNRGEWHKETPLKVCFPLNYKVDGELPRGQLSLIAWVAAKGRVIQPLAHPDFGSYDGPLPLELAKQWDLRTLSVYLREHLTQAEIDQLYPEPQDALDQDSSDSDSDSDSDSN